MRMILLFMVLIPLGLMGQTLSGEWDFDDPTDLLNANTGTDLELVGTHTSIPGPELNDNAIRIGIGSYYRAHHGIPANGGGSMVNEFTLVYDFRIAALGQWHCFYQSNPSNSNDGDAFINPSGQIGVGVTGYSPYILTPGEWYRLVITVDLGSSYKYYLDGQLLQDGGVQLLDGRFSLYPSNPSQPLLLFADDNGEDNQIDIAYAAVYNGCFSSAQAAALGGYGHTITAPTAEMLPYLQTPTPNSIYVCWHAANADESRVEYGSSPALGNTETGNVINLSSTTKWHTVKLEGLMPDTEYYYQCFTGTQSSVVSRFRTAPELGSRTGHFRFLIMGDSQSNSGVSTTIVSRVVQKLTELYGADWHNEVQLLCHVGDSVGNGSNLASYITEHFIPFGPLSARLPVMIAIGNHEVESNYFYQYRCLEDVAGPEGEKYYSFDLGTMRFIFLNPNIGTTIQTPWLQNIIQSADNNPDLDMIFSFSHMPGQSEIWPDGNHAWTLNTVIPSLSTSQKGLLLAGGHSHNYERGLSETGRVTTIISGGSGGDLDRWGMYANQQNYENTLIAYDMYNWILVDVDLENMMYQATMYSMGHPDMPRINEVMDQWSVNVIPVPQEYPLAMTESATISDGLGLYAYPPDQVFDITSARYILASDPSFADVIYDVTEHYINIYGDSGNPNWTPIDLNANKDIWRRFIPTTMLAEGNTYHWKMQVRNRNLDFSPFSETRNFVMQFQEPAAAFSVLNPSVYVGESMYFTESSTGEANGVAWDFDADGIIDSYQRHPSHIYLQAGEYTVTLLVFINNEIHQASQTVEVMSSPISDPELPGVRFQFSVYPNPFKSQTSLELKLDTLSSVRIEIYNLKGQKVKTLVDYSLRTGSHSFLWQGTDDSGKNIGSGIYLCRVYLDDIPVIVRKLSFLK